MLLQQLLGEHARQIAADRRARACQMDERLDHLVWRRIRLAQIANDLFGLIGRQVATQALPVETKQRNPDAGRADGGSARGGDVVRLRHAIPFST